MKIIITVFASGCPLTKEKPSQVVKNHTDYWFSFNSEIYKTVTTCEKLPKKFATTDIRLEGPIFGRY